MITLSQPVWLILLLPLGMALSLWRLPTRGLRICRAIVLILVVLAMCHPDIRLPDRAGTVVVVADRSDSMPSDSAIRQKEIINMLHRSMGPRDQLAVVSFGYQSAIERPPQRAEFGGFSAIVGSDLSNLSEGLDTALGLLSIDTPGRLLVLSDGRWTGRDPAAAAARAAERSIAVDYRLLSRPQVREIAIRQFQVPQTVAPQEAFYLNAWVQSPIEQKARYELRRGSEIIASGEKQLGSGLTRLMFRDRAGHPGTLQYQLRVMGPEDDPCPENNRARALVGVQGVRSILAVAESGSESGLARLLRDGGLQVIAHSPDQCRWTLEDVSQYSAVLLENVMANNLGNAGMETLASWIEQTGAGLFMTGGKKSFGPGGYFRSPLERIMPVSMEMRQEHRKHRIAIVVALDRSGSMAMAAGGGRTKMDLANLGTVQVLDLLSPNDEIGVIAVDSSAHTIVELDSVANNQGRRSKILAIDSMGGGIFIFEALSNAARMLLSAQAETKHIILFADAADSEEPGQYQDLLDNCQKANITVSVVGLGTEADMDAELLKDIARLGQGNCFFSDSPYEIPRLFAQDTFTIARSSFVEETTPLKATPGLNTLGGMPDWQPPEVGGYNLCYARPEANLAVLTTDDYTAPIVAAWQAGNGRVLCFTGEADGQFSGPLAQWPQAGDFYSTLARWTAGEQNDLPDHFALTQEIREGSCHVELHLDPRRAADPFSGTPQVQVLHGIPGQTPARTSVDLKWSSADTLEAWIPIRGNETVLATAAVPGMKPITLSPVCLPYSPEFEAEAGDRGMDALKQLAAATGGEDRLDLAKIWNVLPTRLRRVPLAPWLLIAAMVLFLVEILQRRTSILTLAWRRLRPSLVDPIARSAPSWTLRRFFKRKSPPRPIVSTETPSVLPQPSPPPSPITASVPSEVTNPAPAGTIEAMRKARARAKSRRQSE
ncbi:MAG TPA: VWA domain-containing protein [Candidatus Paceibacterota bacterium]|nr:VWA domain-containing protein [Verrucomicrobiota bacterium]HRY49928.1 VWA domain-containing protein [Candidatus Paceibacterota bacterium]